MLHTAMGEQNDAGKAAAGAVPPSTEPAGALRETHISLVVLSGERVYKFRKPVRFGFVDFSSAAARAADCERETELNRRLAPDVYLGVAELRLDDAVLDYAVVMRRLPEARSLAALVALGAPPEREIDAVAATLANFHRGATRSVQIDAAAAPTALADAFAAVRAQLTRFVGPVLDPATHARVVTLAEAFVAGHPGLLAERVAGGMICDGHGDLQAGDVFCLDDGPRLLDCLEFDDVLRYGDVAADLAFLAMDLERLGAPDGARLLVRRYEAHAQVEIPPALLDYYVAMRAYVRALVSCLRGEQGDDAATTQAGVLLDLARHALERSQPYLVLVGGLPGSGKSTLARSLEQALGVAVLRSDAVRLELVESDRTALSGPRFATGAFAPAVTRRVYAALFEAAEAELTRTGSVVIDASFIDESQRVAARGLGARLGARVVELHCAVPDVVAAQRIEWRAAQGGDPSRATLSTRRMMARLEDPWPEAAEVDTARSAEEALASALKIVRA